MGHFYGAFMAFQSILCNGIENSELFSSFFLVSFSGYQFLLDLFQLCFTLRHILERLYCFANILCIDFYSPQESTYKPCICFPLPRLCHLNGILG